LRALLLVLGAFVPLSASQTGGPHPFHYTVTISGVEFPSRRIPTRSLGEAGPSQPSPEAVARMIDLGVAQSGSRQFSIEAISTFTAWTSNRAEQPLLLSLARTSIFVHP